MPDRTWNTLLALLTPIVVLTGCATLQDRGNRWLLNAILVIALLSAILALAQIAAGQQSALYYYTQSHREYPVGFFANRNHQAVFLALMLPLLRFWEFDHRDLIKAEIPRVVITAVLFLFLIAMIIITGSRAGLAIMVVGLLVTYLIRPKFSRRIGRTGILALSVSVIAILAVTLATLASGRATALTRIWQTRDIANDLRFAFLPAMLRMLSDFFPFGTGFGAFTEAFKMYEPDRLLRPSYFNNAHNDLLELLITGGLPAVLVLIAFLGWWGKLTYTVFAKPDHESKNLVRARAGSMMILMLLLASLVDYPLRTPILSALMTLSSVWLAAGARKTVSTSRLR